MVRDKQTEKSFRDKWNNNKLFAFKETQDPNSFILNWILTRNGFGNIQDLRNSLKGKRRILDAGCGNGRVTKLIRDSSPAETEVVGFDLTSADVARSNLSSEKNLKIYTKDLSDDLSSLGKFDLIYCQEVLHHTPNPKKSFNNLCNILSKDGEIWIYVYRVKAPAREFLDDYIRKKISLMDYDSAFNNLKQITNLGKVLSETNIEITIPDVDLLEIKAGTYSLQRFLYHHFFKCFWNEEFSFDENNAINYDWYHPNLCSRHTPEEVKEWLLSQGLIINLAYEDHYGITFHASSSLQEKS